MSYTKRFLIEIISFISLVLVSGAFASSPKMPAQTVKGESYLFVQSADTATLKAVDVPKGVYSLTLNNIPQNVTYFSDRPGRSIGLMNSTKFFNLWQKNKKDSFGQIPPNGNVQGIKSHDLIDEQDVNVTVTLRNPNYDQKSNSVTYEVTVLGDNKNINTKKTGTLHHVIIVFDAWCPSCCCG